MRGMFFMHTSVDLFASRSLTASIHLFSSLLIYTLVHLAQTRTRLVGNDERRQDFPPHSLRTSREVRGRRKEEKNAEKNVDEQYSSRSRLVKCTIELLRLTDTQRPDKVPLII